MWYCFYQAVTIKPTGRTHFFWQCTLILNKSNSDEWRKVLYFLSFQCPSDSNPTWGLVRDSVSKETDFVKKSGIRKEHWRKSDTREAMFPSETASNVGSLFARSWLQPFCAKKCLITVDLSCDRTNKENNRTLCCVISKKKQWYSKKHLFIVGDSWWCVVDSNVVRAKNNVVWHVRRCVWEATTNDIGGEASDWRRDLKVIE
jgi:hypothetical protein